MGDPDDASGKEVDLNATKQEGEMVATFYSQVWRYRSQKLLQDFTGLNYFSLQLQTMTKSLHLKEIITDSQSIFSYLGP